MISTLANINYILLSSNGSAIYSRFSESINGGYADLHLRTHKLSDTNSRNDEAVKLMGKAVGRNAYVL